MASYIPKVEKTINELVFSHFSVDALLSVIRKKNNQTLLIKMETSSRKGGTHLESIHHNLLVSRPRRDFTQELLESPKTNPCLRFLFVAFSGGEQRRRRCNRRRWRDDAHSLVQRVIDKPRLFLIEPSEGFQIADCTAFSERFNAVDDLASEAPPFRQDDVFSDNREFSKRHEKQFLEDCDGACARIGGIGVCRISQGSEVVSHQAGCIVRLGKCEAIFGSYFKNCPSSWICSSCSPLIFSIANEVRSAMKNGTNRDETDPTCDVC
jgi:hypothetical protein